MKQELMDTIDESQVIVEMLCNNTWKDEWFEYIDPDELVTLAVKNMVLSTVANFIFDNAIDGIFKGSNAYSRLKESLLLNERDKIIYKQTLNQIVEDFSVEGIDLCLLKGLSLEGGTARDMGDLDLLIHEEDLLKAINRMETMGFAYVGDKRNRYMKKSEKRQWDKLISWSNQFEFFDEKTGVLIELHSNLFERKRVYRFNLDRFLDTIDDFWLNAVWSQELQCKVFTRSDNFWLLAMHNAIKRSAAKDYFALRTILDMRNLLAKEEPNWDDLFKRALETDTLVFVVYSLEMVQLFSPHLSLDEAIRTGNSQLKPGKLFLNKILHKCFFNLKTVSFIQNFLFRLFIPFIQKSTFKDKIVSLLVFPVIYQPKWRLRQLYLLPKKSKLVLFTYFLEPIRWIRITCRKKRSDKTVFPLR